MVIDLLSLLLQVSFLLQYFLRQWYHSIRGLGCTWAVSVFKALVEMGPLRGGGEVMQRGHRDRWTADTGSV